MASAASSIPITPEELDQYPGIDYIPEPLSLRDVVREAIRGIARFNREDLEDAIYVLQEHYRAQPKLELSTSGPCLRCTTPISYLPLSGAHKRFGEEWFIKLKNEANVKGFLIDGRQRFESRGLLLAGRQFHFFRNFICKPCLEYLRDKHRPLTFVATKQEVERRKLQDEHQAAEKAEREHLRTCRYKDFLNSEHWKGVRARALKRAGYRCELCSSRYQGLNVHHKTYANRGYEDRNMGDLIVLCEICHGKFHDKVATPPGDANVQ